MPSFSTLPESSISSASAAIAALKLNGAPVAKSLSPTKATPASANKMAFTRPAFTFTPAVDLDDASIPMRVRMTHHLTGLQATITSALDSLEEQAGSDARFKSMHYLRPTETGYGDARVLQGGKTFEKGGCSLSVIKSTLSVAAIKQMRSEQFTWWDGVSELPFFVASVSCVIHPANPHAPTTHWNYRYFEITDAGEPDGAPKAWWFAGGTDLTPSYLYDDDAKHFHGIFKTACDKSDLAYYPRFKKWCDEYFYLPHRQETRGIGGIFFDDLAEGNPEDLFKFVRNCSNGFLPAYYPIMEKRRVMPFTEEQRRWQQLRRGLYAEFNVMIDRGTKFGLQGKDPRTENILMTLPLTARWEYEPELGTIEGTPEKRLKDVCQHPIEWV